MSYRSKSQGLGIPLGIAYMDIQSNGPTEVPLMPLPVNNSIHTPTERSIASQYINHLNNLNDSVFNLGKLHQDQDVANQSHIDRYSDKYLKNLDPSINLNIDSHPFHLEVFPRELYNVMGINKRKLLQIKHLKLNQDNETAMDNELNGNNLLENDMGLNMLQKLKELADEVDDLEKDGKKNATVSKEGQDEDEFDDDFDEDEDDDDDNDYNAEKYFNNGDDDDMDDDIDNDEPAFG